MPFTFAKMIPAIEPGSSGFGLGSGAADASSSSGDQRNGAIELASA
jgi:hypothetical protein